MKRRWPNNAPKKNADKKNWKMRASSAEAELASAVCRLAIALVVVP
jgi:hypothetical protein